MKKTLLILLFAGLFSALQAQTPENPHPTASDSLLAARIIDNYNQLTNFEPILKDSILCVVTYMVYRDRPLDTMWVYHWYGSDRRLRIEMWQNGKIQEGYYSDGALIFRKFQAATRSWTDIPQDRFYDFSIPHDVRGALYDWRSKGGEAWYAGQYTFEGKKVNRVFMSMPKAFDRYYFFEAETGLLFMVTENDHIFGDWKKGERSRRIDWRAWHEFTPFRGYFLPTIESYQYDQSQIIIIHRQYHFEAFQPKLFSEDYHKR